MQHLGQSKSISFDRGSKQPSTPVKGADQTTTQQQAPIYHSFYTNKAELELEIGKYKAKKTEDMINSMKRRYSIFLY